MKRSFDSVGSRDGRVGVVGVAFAAAALCCVASSSVASEPSVETLRAIERANDLSVAFSHAAQVIDPSLVHITVEREFDVPGAERRRARPGIPPEFERFFGRDPFEGFFERRGPAQPRRFSNDSLGSGVIVSEDGYILTNHHVVAAGGPEIDPEVLFRRNRGEDGAFGLPFGRDGESSGESLYRGVNEALTITVTLHDGDERSATLVGSDPATDIALLKLDAREGELFTAARFADSGELSVGQWVVAAGSPFGLGRTITTGIVSALGRTGVGLSAYESYIQTDAAINPGNSGGPLLNLRGEVVGINTAIATRSGGFNGVGFAIPSNLARATMIDLKDDGVAERGLIGLYGQTLTSRLSETLGVGVSRGALITEVIGGSPAEEAGLRRGDVVVALDGEVVRSFEDLRVRVAERSPGERVVLKVLRDSEEMEVVVTLVSSRDLGLIAGRDSTVGGIADDLGLTLAEGDGRDGGLRIVEVEAGSPAQMAGLRPGERVVAVGRRTLGSLDDWAEAMASVDLDRGVALLVRSDRGLRYVVLRGDR